MQLTEPVKGLPRYINPVKGLWVKRKITNAALLRQEKELNDTSMIGYYLQYKCGSPRRISPSHMGS